MLTAGEHLGPYEILAPLGAGGMGEVYRAKDPRLKREVAVKVLPEAFARDSGRMARFQREAEVLAALNHPNIAQIYGAEEQALVMELVEGATLAERIQQGAIPLDESLEIGRQIAEALEAAHEKGIVHRDLKPANVKIKPDGTVKVLDFGLAAILQTTPSGATDPAHSPTLTLGATQVGAIMGTAGYMSPEQAVGKAVDRRADIWSFGVVLFEMLTGSHLFTGETASHILADVIRGEIDFGKLPSSTPGAIRNLLKRCLDRDVKNRLQWIGEARVAIGNAGKEPETAVPAPARSRLRIGGWLAAGVLAIAAAVFAALWLRSARPAEKPLVRLDVDLGADVSLPPPGNVYRGNAFRTVVISPDGSRIAYLSGNPRRISVRKLDQPTATELPGTDGAMDPFFSPDGEWVAFHGQSMNKISAEGGAVVPLATPLGYLGGNWGEDGNILVGGPLGLTRVPPGGGPFTTLMEKANGELGDATPQLLPGGKAVLFTSFPMLALKKASVEALNLADHRRKVLVRGAYGPIYLPSGHLIYTLGRALFAVPFDADKLEIRGNAVPVLDDIEPDDLGFGDISVSRNGTLVYRRGSGAAVESTIEWLDATGKKQALAVKPGGYTNLRLSPDGKRVALLARNGDSQDVWVYDLERGTMTRLSSGDSLLTTVAWTPDGRYVVFGALGVPMTSARSDGSGQPQPLVAGLPAPAPGSFTPDGKRLTSFDFILSQIFAASVEEQGGQLKTGKPEPFLQTRFNDRYPAVAPDGRWLAYQSDATGKNEIYVRAFPQPASGAGDQVQVSNDGGTQPVWAPNGHDLLYQSGDQIMAASYTVKDNAFVPEKPRVWLAKLGGATGWDLAPDGKRLAVITPVGNSEAPKTEHEIVVLQNFFDYLRQRLPVK